MNVLNRSLATRWCPGKSKLPTFTLGVRFASANWCHSLLSDTSNTIQKTSARILSTIETEQVAAEQTEPASTAEAITDAALAKVA